VISTLSCPGTPTPESHSPPCTPPSGNSPHPPEGGGAQEDWLSPSGRQPSGPLGGWAASSRGGPGAGPWVRRCLRRSAAPRKALPQRWQPWGRTPEWMRSCLRRLARSAKLFPHSPHWNGRSPECTSWCRLRSQEGRSPVWIPLLHLSHWYGLTPWWARWWRRKLEGSENMRPHCGQRNGFSPEWVRWWLW
uniref:Uncharacterized protein n=1 Tax=Gopherus agassizii TaxID=38772 RepID=A0A452IDM5_9SAUR